MSLLFRRESRSLLQTFPEPPLAPLYGHDYAGRVSVSNNPDAALTVPTVWACVGLLANAVSMLPLETFRRSGGIPARIPDPPLLVNPAGDMTQSEWLHMLMVSLLLRGNAFGRIVARDGAQRPTQIELLSPDRVRLEIDRDTGALTYFVNGAKVPSSDIWHVRGFTLPGSRIGLSPISYAAATIGVDIASRHFSQDFFAGGGIPKAIIKTDQDVNQQQSRTIKERLLAASRNREPVVLARGLEYEQISVNPEESQFLLTQQANVSQIARYFWVPPEMVGGSSGNNLTYANVEQRQLDFLTLGVSFWLKRIEDAIFPLLPAPQYVRFNTAALLRTDAKTQAEVDNMQLAGKTRLVSELRARDGLPPYSPEQQAEAEMVPLEITPSGGAKAKPASTPPAEPAPAPVTNVNAYVMPAEVRLEQPVFVQPAEVRQDITVQPSAAPEIRLEQPITVQPATAPEVRLEQPITVAPAAAPEVRQEIVVQPADVRVVNTAPEVRSRRVERDEHGEILRIVEE